MKLELIRKTCSDLSTIGRLYIDGAYECVTLEDRVREVKVMGETAIPQGVYPIKITYSPRFKKDLPLLLDVPGFEGVRIHSGNNHSQTEGCILVGEIAGQDVIWNSRKAFDSLFKKLKIAKDTNEEITIEIRS